VVYNWVEWIQDLLYPRRCLLCGAAGADGMDLCLGCRADLPWPGSACPVCATPLPHPGPAPCGACQQRPPAFDAARALLHYVTPVDHLVQQLKFHHRLVVANLFAALMDRALAGGDWRPAPLMPVPLHASRLRERGFNQALEIARPLARALEVPLLDRHCRRSRATPAQSGLDAATRRRNLRGAFEVVRPIEHDRVTLIDDVMTTGSTLDELASTLKQAGVERVELCVVARTPPGNGQS